MIIMCYLNNNNIYLHINTVYQVTFTSLTAGDSKYTTKYSNIVSLTAQFTNFDATVCITTTPPAALYDQLTNFFLIVHVHSSPLNLAKDPSATLHRQSGMICLLI